MLLALAHLMLILLVMSALIFTFIVFITLKEMVNLPRRISDYPDGFIGFNSFMMTGIAAVIDLGNRIGFRLVGLLALGVGFRLARASCGGLADRAVHRAGAEGVERQ